jgi:hypothetical protein
MHKWRGTVYALVIWCAMGVPEALTQEAGEAGKAECHREVIGIQTEKNTEEGQGEEESFFSIHGTLVGYYQGADGFDSGGVHFSNIDGGGYVADLEVSLAPIKGGELYVRIHTGDGDGADRTLEEEGALFADLNTLNDDNTGDGDFDMLECHYTQHFKDDQWFVTLGKTEPLVFMDDNVLANCEVGQFWGKPFVNNPMLDSEDEFAPLVAVGYSPRERLSLVGVYQSSFRPRREGREQKDKYKDGFDEPFLGGQLTYSPQVCGREGNYRLYGWLQAYEQPELTGSATDQGWGIGLSADQTLTERLGVFGRFGYHNEEVYEVPWFWSLGAVLTGPIPARGDDQIGLGIAGLKANEDFADDDTELHTELYYRSVFHEHFALTLDCQFVANPLGDCGSDEVVAGGIRGEISF